MRRRLATAFVVILAVTAAAASAPTPLPPEILTCSGLKRNAERLACYDQAIEHLQRGDSAATGTTATPSATAVFGASATSSPVKRDDDSTERQELRSITANVAALRTDRQGMSSIELDNGQTWRQIDGSSRLMLKVGDEVTVSRAALGSFLMAVPSGPAIRVRRVQ